MGVFTSLDFFLFFLFWELELVPIGDAAPQALRGLRGGWRSPRRRLRAHGPGRAGVGLHPELQNRVRLLPVAQPQTYLLPADSRAGQGG